MNQIFRKSLILILDGLGDLPATVLGGRTPLEAAKTPVMNRLATSGLYGLVDPERPGKVANTHSGCGALMGVPPTVANSLKRGPIEASGVGRRLKPGEIAVRANFATLEKESGRYRIVDRRAGRISAGTQDLVAGLKCVDLGDGVFAELHSTDQHRCVLVMSGPGLDARISDTDPGDRGMPGFVQICRGETVEAELTAQKINRFIEMAHRDLSGHPVNRARIESGLLPANGIITRGAGGALALENVVHNQGIRSALVAGCNTVIGLARALDIDVITNRSFTADADTDLEGKVRAALQAFERHDLVYLHIKATDIFAHDQRPRDKSEFIEQIDAALSLLEQTGVIIALSADHSTDSNSGSHTADPVPALLFDPDSASVAEPVGLNFGEAACASGTMPRQNGHAFLLRLLDLMLKDTSRKV